jgi:hypothetical protein
LLGTCGLQVSADLYVE